MLRVTGLHIEPTNICTLKCPGCSRTQFLQQWPTKWKNHSVDIPSLMNFLDIDLTGMLINLCGNNGDPIYHPNFIEMIAALKKRHVKISIDTNGSYKNKRWWQEMLSYLDGNDRIRFSIDGLPESFINYRINADWTSIREGIIQCVTSPVTTSWKFIPFSFNEKEIELARSLAKDLGFDEFDVIKSDRFDKHTEHLIPVAELVGSRKASQNLVSEGAVVPIYPKCQSGKEHFISATGHYSPCCFVADYRYLYKTQFGKAAENFTISDHTFSEILESRLVQDFFQDLHVSPPGVCQFNCPKT